MKRKASRKRRVASVHFAEACDGIASFTRAIRDAVITSAFPIHQAAQKSLSRLAVEHAGIVAAGDQLKYGVRDFEASAPAILEREKPDLRSQIDTAPLGLFLARFAIAKIFAFANIDKLRAFEAT